MKRSRYMLKDKVVIVTGAAGGIGQALTRIFARSGASLVLTDIGMAELERQSRLFCPPEAANLLVRHDVTDPRSWDSLLDAVLKEFGRLDILINNAGVVQPGPAEKLSFDQVLRQISVNLMGTVLGCQTALRLMKKQNRGKIINIASLGGIVPMPGEAVYCATKFAIRGYSLSLYGELLDSPVSITVVCPDSVDTTQLAYELLHDEAVLSFVSSPMKPERVARGVLKAVFKDTPEILIPGAMGNFSRVGMGFPGIFFALFPILRKMGIKTMKKKREEKENGSVTLHCDGV
ncbi:MAG: SDR family oxidoreductase [Candidatus Aminicenantes bacterium]|nr:SDR family oxidoreductase [Candidatus Aminicenantes bacterium]